MARPTPSRDYGGRSADTRRAERRTRLTAVARTEVLAGRYGTTPIERLCEMAKVSTRAFYQEFDDRADLLRVALAELGHEETLLPMARALAAGQARMCPACDMDRVEFGVLDFQAWYLAEVGRLRNGIDADQVYDDVCNKIVEGEDGGSLDYSHALRTAIETTIASIGTRPAVSHEDVIRAAVEQLDYLNGQIKSLEQTFPHVGRSLRATHDRLADVLGWAGS